MAGLLSHNTFTRRRLGTLSSSMSYKIQRITVVIEATPLYSTSVEDLKIVFCFIAFPRDKVFIKENTNDQTLRQISFQGGIFPGQHLQMREV